MISRGRKISVSTVGGLTDWLVHEVSRRQGWGSDGINVVPLGSDEAQIAAMRTLKVDGMPLDVGGAALLEEKGAARILLPFGEVVRDFINHVTYATNAFVEMKALPAAPDMAKLYTERFLPDYRQ
jgi:ABC-type nitrate/sulfonate/bicarbonate transport system substrate-binding protein